MKELFWKQQYDKRRKMLKSNLYDVLHTLDQQLQDEIKCKAKKSILNFVNTNNISKQRLDEIHEFIYPILIECFNELIDICRQKNIVLHFVNLPTGLQIKEYQDVPYVVRTQLYQKQDFIELGNIDSKRDWGYAPIFVKAMHLMLQQEQPDDYVVATGENHSVRQFLDIAFNYVGIKDWNKYIRINPELYRPAEVDVLVGDPSKIKSIGWQYNMAFKDLVETMMKEQLNISN